MNLPLCHHVTTTQTPMNEAEAYPGCDVVTSVTPVTEDAASNTSGAAAISDVSGALHPVAERAAADASAGASERNFGARRADYRGADVAPLTGENPGNHKASYQTQKHGEPVDFQVITDTFAPPESSLTGNPAALSGAEQGRKSEDEPPFRDNGADCGTADGARPAVAGWRCRCGAGLHPTIPALCARGHNAPGNPGRRGRHRLQDDDADVPEGFTLPDANASQDATGAARQYVQEAMRLAKREAERITKRLAHAEISRQQRREEEKALRLLLAEMGSLSAQLARLPLPEADIAPLVIDHVTPADVGRVRDRDEEDGPRPGRRSQGERVPEPRALPPPAADVAPAGNVATSAPGQVKAAQSQEDGLPWQMHESGVREVLQQDGSNYRDDLPVYGYRSQKGFGWISALGFQTSHEH